MPGSRSNQSGNRNAAPAEGAEMASDSVPTPASGRTEPGADETVPENQAVELPMDNVKLDGIPILNGDRATNRPDNTEAKAERSEL